MPHPYAVQFEPMHDRTNPSKPTQRGTNHGRQHGGQRMTPSQAPARIGNSLETLQQAPGGLNIHGKTFAISRTNNGGTFLPRQTPKISSYSAILFHQGKLTRRRTLASLQIISRLQILFNVCVAPRVKQ